MERWKSEQPKRDLLATLEPATKECVRRMIEFMGEQVFREGAAEIYFAHGPCYGHDVEGWFGRIVMMAEGSIDTLAFLAWLFLRLAEESETRQRLIEQGVDPRTVKRAVRYGRADSLQ